MKGSRRRRVKRTRTMRRKKGGDCGCGKKIFGGYGAASYQGGINNTILPLNNNNGSVSDPLASGNITEERFAKFVGGKKSRKNKKSVRFGGMSTDLLLGNFGSSNPLLNSATSSHAINAAQVINGQKPF